MKNEKWKTENGKCLAEIDLEMKAKALAKCEVTEKPQQYKHWRDQPSNGVPAYLVVGRTRHVP